jgi:hypothetical protein
VVVHGSANQVNQLNSSNIDRGALTDGKGLAVSNVSQVGDELEAIDNLAASLCTSVDTKAEYTSESISQVSLGTFM